MNVNITTDELKVLAFFYEHATGYTPADVLTPPKFQVAMEELDLTEADFRRQVTFVASFGLLGVREVSFNNSMGSGAQITGIGITGQGVNYLRELQAEIERKEPGKLQKISVKTIAVIGEAGRQIAVKVLTEFLTGPVGHLAGGILRGHGQ